MIDKIMAALIQIQPSKMLDGEIGVFAIRNLKGGTIVGDASLLADIYFYTWDDFNRIDKITQEQIIRFCGGNDKGFYVPKNINYISIPYHFNHSCSGNIGFDQNDNFITMKNISAGVELCYDYALAESNPNYKMECKCGTRNCRKIITGNDWKIKDLQKKYDGYFLRHIQEKINDMKNKK